MYKCKLLPDEEDVSVFIIILTYAGSLEHLIQE